MRTGRTISPESLAARIEAGTAPALLDVRSAREFAHGHIPGAQHIPFWLIRWRVDDVIARPDDEVVLYCGRGPRAWMAGRVLREHGFRHVSYLAGHFAAWHAKGFAAET
jgi:rhodanese-related sulfurtransferase